MCQNAFFPCLQGINMLRSKREEQKTNVNIQSRVQKKINSWLRKKLRSFKNSSYL